MPKSLFGCRLLEPAPDASPEIVTPLGILTLDAAFDGIVIGDLKPSFAHRLERNGYLLNWTLDDVTAELLLCRPRFTLYEGISITDCLAGVWRMQAATAAVPGNRPEFSCRWEPGYQWTERGPNSGEGLDAQTWENAETIATVGTSDCEWLAGQAKRGFMPLRWASMLGGSYGGTTPDLATGKLDPVVYLEDGFRLVMPALDPSETCQVHFVVAWSPNTGDKEADFATWSAVDQAPEKILADAACRN